MLSDKPTIVLKNFLFETFQNTTNSFKKLGSINRFSLHMTDFI